MTVERDGDGFLLHKARVFTPGDEKPTVYPEGKEAAIYKGGQLQVGGGLGAYVIDKASGHLVSPEGDGEYARARCHQERLLVRAVSVVVGAAAEGPSRSGSCGQPEPRPPRKRSLDRST